MDQSLLDRFFSRIIPEPNSGCWLYDGNWNNKGYGQLKDHGECVRTHRLSYELYKGPIPDGMHVCHTCDVPCCCNPDHLFLGSNKDNIHDSIKKGRHVVPGNVGIRNGQAKLTEKEVIEIRKDERPNQLIAESYNTSVSNIVLIKKRKRWRHVGEENG